jgi:hypothetical protein
VQLPVFLAKMNAPIGEIEGQTPIPRRCLALKRKQLSLLHLAEKDWEILTKLFSELRNTTLHPKLRPLRLFLIVHPLCLVAEALEEFLASGA